MKTQIIFASLICLFFASCIPTSIHPFYTKETLVNADQILGSWKEKEFSLEIDTENIKVDTTTLNWKENSTITIFQEWKFVKGNEKGSYDLEIISPNQTILEAYFDLWDEKDPASNLKIQETLDQDKTYENESYHLDVNAFKIDDQIYLNFYPDHSEMDSKRVFYDDHMLPVHSFAKLVEKGDEMNLRFLDRSKFMKLIENQMIKIKHEKTEDHVILTASTRNLQKFLEKYGDDDSLFDKEGKVLVGVEKAH